MELTNLKDYKNHFKRLVELERKEEINRHWNEIKNLSPKERQAKGRAVLNLRSRDAGRGLGGTYLIKYVRKDGLPDTEISISDLVIVSSGDPNGEEPQATVTEKTNYSITVAFNDKPPRFVRKKPLRMDLFANDITFQRMLDAIQEVHKNDDIAPLLVNKRAPQWHEVGEIEFHNTKLNNSQRQAVQRSLEARDFFLIHGPPGTGKTTTLVESIMQHVHQGDTVLATADSNTAVDNLVDILTEQGCNAVRIGNPVRVTDSLLNHTLDYKVQQTEEFRKASQYWEEIDRLKDKQDEHVFPSGKNRRGLGNGKIKKLAEQGKSSRGLSPGKIKGMARWIEIQEEIEQLVEEARKLEQKATNNQLEEADVICSTNSTAGSEIMDTFLEGQQHHIDVVFIDEATQSVEPSCLIPMEKAPKFIMAGDHKQLPPTVLHREAEKELQYTLFERLLDLYSEDVKQLLDTQYRMHEEIMAFPSEEFYEERLIADESVARHTLEDLVDDYGRFKQQESWIKEIIQPDQPKIFVDTQDHRHPWERQREGSYSRENETEAEVLEPVVRSLVDTGINPEHIGVITPYDDQVDRLRGQLGDIEHLEVKTVDGFQGREKEVIIISFVRANEREELGFLTDLRRLNVSITRARRKLIMIGHAPTLKTHPVYKQMIESAPVLKYADKSVAM